MKILFLLPNLTSVMTYSHLINEITALGPSGDITCVHTLISEGNPVTQGCTNAGELLETITGIDVIFCTSKFNPLIRQRNKKYPPMFLIHPGTTPQQLLPSLEEVGRKLDIAK